ncbi:MAG: HEAT repeat domain-containing protein [Synechococcales cyanobacterium C42_A2020_086]|nr:HEAT repeat domain-containing protein [Synechococcales cyanobacterium C42_A2020_086]
MNVTQPYVMDDLRSASCLSSLSAAEHESHEWRLALAEALEALQIGDFETRWEIAKHFHRFGKLAIAPLLTLLQEEADGDWELLWFVARILGQFQDPVTLSALTELLKTAENSQVAGMAASALAQIGTPAIASLQELLQSPETRLLAVQALAQIRHLQVLPVLLQTVQDTDPAIRAVAIEALSHYHTPEVFSVLLAALRDPAAAVRRAAVVGLGMQADPLNGPDVIQALYPLLWDLNPQVCQQVVIALGRVGTPEAAVKLGQLIQSPHTPIDLSCEAVRALVWIGDAPALEQLQSILDQSHQVPVVAGALSGEHVQTLHREIIVGLGRVETASAKRFATQILLRVLRASHPVTQVPEVRRDIAQSLGQLGQADAIEALLQLLADSEATVRLHAIAALKQLESQGAYQRLQACLHTARDASLKAGIEAALHEWSVHACLSEG